MLCMKENEAQTNLPSMFLGLFSQRHLREKGEEASLRAADLLVQPWMINDRSTDYNVNLVFYFRLMFDF